MAKKHDRRPRKEDTRQANTIIAVVSLIGLSSVVIFAPQKDAPTTLLLYGIFGGGILGADVMLKFIKAILRIR